VTVVVGSHWGTIQDAAETYKVSEDTIRRMITRGEIDARRFGPRLIRVNLDSIIAAAQPLAAVA
jgi:excisionase family DNA binding protein